MPNLQMKFRVIKPFAQVTYPEKVKIKMCTQTYLILYISPLLFPHR